MIDVLISIVNYNTRDLLKKCLESILKTAQNLNYETVVVDNGSWDGSVKMLKEVFPWVKLIVNEKNIGLNPSRSKGLKVCGGARYILFLDNDVELMSHSLEKMVEFMDAHPDCGITSPKVLFPDGRTQHSWNKKFPTLAHSVASKLFFYNSIRYSLYRSSFLAKYIYRNYNKNQEVAWAGGMCLLIREEALKIIGYLDDDFFIFYEDTDVCLRIKNAGYKIYYLSQPTVIHHYESTVKQFSNELYLKFCESEWHFYEKHHGKNALKLVKIATWLGILLRAAALGIVWFFKPSRRNNIKERLKSYKKVYEKLHTKAS